MRRTSSQKRKLRPFRGAFFLRKPHRLRWVLGGNMLVFTWNPHMSHANFNDFQHQKKANSCTKMPWKPSNDHNSWSPWIRTFATLAPPNCHSFNSLSFNSQKREKMSLCHHITQQHKPQTTSMESTARPGTSRSLKSNFSTRPPHGHAQ